MRIACVQANVKFNDPAANIANAIAKIEELASAGVEFVVFPEAFLTGYCVGTRRDAERIAIDASALQPLQTCVERLGTIVVIGFAECADGELFNTAALIEPGVPMRFYRKTHLPFLGYDRFVRAGDALPTFDTRIGRIGILICYDLRPPEAARALALKGADLIVLPTNWPVGATAAARPVSVVRALENKVFLATCNRVGEENGFRFIGLSKILDPYGAALAEAQDEETTILADIDLAVARNKRNVIIPGEYELAIFDSRRPDLYGVLAEPLEAPATLQ